MKVDLMCAPHYAMQYDNFIVHAVIAIHDTAR